VLSTNEEEEVQDLTLKNKSTFMKSDLSTLTKALEKQSKFADKGMMN
jgi:hypothetical protein